ncbi:response regulator [Candidatus Woesearchaeota archaeon]|nr:response regulator [Candidatus Woesearchaeota archaeon]
MTERKLVALLVEDEEFLKELLADYMSKKLGLSVRTAVDGQDGYDQIRAQKPDILLTDVTMPNMTGDTLLEKLVSDGIRIPTLVITAGDTTRESARAIYFSHRMYTEEQLHRLKLPIQHTIEEQIAYMNKAPITTISRHAIVRYERDLGFTTIIKPDVIDYLQRRINQLKELLDASHDFQS